MNGRDFGDPPYPPIVDQSIASGAHLVVLTCPDGQQRRLPVTVVPGRGGIVTIR
jgi:hypothetical protein